MIKSKTIRLSKAKKVFPNSITRLRAHDIIKISVDKKKYLTLKEQEKLQTLANEIRNGLFGENCDVLATRKVKQVKFVKF